MAPKSIAQKSEGPADDVVVPDGTNDFGAWGSSESVKSELAMFNGPSYQVTHLRGQWLQLLPENQYQGSAGTNIQFKIPNAAGWYLDFNDSYVLVEAKIVTSDDKAVGPKNLVAFENFALGTLFKDVSFTTLTNTKLEGETQSYHYRAYLYTLLNASYSTMKFQLGVAGWARDEAGKFDEKYAADVLDSDGSVKTKHWKRWFPHTIPVDQGW